MPLSLSSFLKIGTFDGQEPREEQRMRLTNGICLVGLVILPMYIAFLMYNHYWLGVLNGGGNLLVFILPLVFNYFHKPLKARLILCIGSNIFFTIMAIWYGQDSGAVYWFFITAMLPILVFDSRRVMISLFSLSLLGFLISATYLEFHPHLYDHAHWGIFYIPNIIAIFSASFAIVYSLRSEHERFEHII